MTADDDLRDASAGGASCDLAHVDLRLHVDTAERLHHLLHAYGDLVDRYEQLVRFRSAVESFVASYPPTERATHPARSVVAQLRGILKEF